MQDCLNVWVNREHQEEVTSPAASEIYNKVHGHTMDPMSLEPPEQNLVILMVNFYGYTHAKASDINIAKLVLYVPKHHLHWFYWEHTNRVQI